MALGKYAAECEALADELRESLGEEDVAQLHELLAGRQIQEWIRWRDANINLVVDFVAASPSQRKRKKFDGQRLLLTLAGIQHCLEAHALLTVIDESFLEPGCSYREVAARAGEAYDHLFDFNVPDWPFDEPDSPFTPAQPLRQP